MPCAQSNLRVDTTECCTHCSKLYLFSTAVDAFLHAAFKSCCNPCFGLEIDFLQVWVNSEGFAIGMPESSKLFPIIRSCFHSPIGDAFLQLGNHFRTQSEGKTEALLGTLMKKRELGIYEGYKLGIVSAIQLFGISKGAIWNVAKHIQISCNMRSH